MLFNDLEMNNLRSHVNSVVEVGDAYMSLEQYETALKYFLMLDNNADDHEAMVSQHIFSLHFVPIGGYIYI